MGTTKGATASLKRKGETTRPANADSTCSRKEEADQGKKHFHGEVELYSLFIRLRVLYENLSFLSKLLAELPANPKSGKRGKFIESSLAPYVMATVHPASILRAPDEESRHTENQKFIADLKQIKKLKI